MWDRLVRALRPWPTHPIDRAYGIKTSAQVRHRRLVTGNPTLDAANVGYAGSQPSVVRRAIQSLGDVSKARFYDLGCGKGRVLAVATEFPFVGITGIELHEPMAALAGANCRALHRRFRDRTPATAVVGDATTPRLPSEGDAVLFLYNSFRRPLVERLLAHLEVAIDPSSPQRIWLIYYNPVCFDLVDASPAFTRHFAERITYEPEEIAAHPFANDFDSVVIWQGSSNRPAPPCPGADSPVVVTIPDLAAEVSML